MKFRGMASDVDEEGRTAEEKAEKGEFLISAHPLLMIPGFLGSQKSQLLCQLRVQTELWTLL